MDIVKSKQNIQFATAGTIAGTRDFIVNNGIGLFIVSYRTSTESSYDGYCILKIYDNNPVLVAITGMKDNAGVVASLSCNKYTASTNTISMNIHSYCNVLFITF